MAAKTPKPASSTRASKLAPKPPEVITPAVRALLDWAQAQGVVAEAELIATPDKPTLGIGMFNTKTKDLAVMAASTNEGNYTVTHELIHALAGSRRVSATRKASDLADRLSETDQKEVVLPRHWVQGALDNPLSTPRRVMDRPNRVKDAAKKTNEQRMRLLRESIDPAVWENRSGIKPAGQPGSPDDPEEAHAYYLSDPYMQNVPLDQRAKEAGMFLLDLGVPMQIVEGVVADLAKVTSPKDGPRWSGGSKELVDVLNGIESRRVVQKAQNPQPQQSSQDSTRKSEAILQEIGW